MNKFECPHRKTKSLIGDFWTEDDRCTYCGCINPHTFLEAVDKGIEIVYDSKEKGFFVYGKKLDINHCSKEQLETLQNYYESGMMKVIKK